jgi:hypothetical protein
VNRRRKSALSPLLIFGAFFERSRGAGIELLERVELLQVRDVYISSDLFDARGLGRCCVRIDRPGVKRHLSLQRRWKPGLFFESLVSVSPEATEAGRIQLDCGR